MLAVVASQALFVTDRTPPLPLGKYLELIRSYVPPVVEDRVLGTELGQLADAITANIFAPDERIDSNSA